MKLSPPRHFSDGRSAFTMVEIAICLAVIVFGLVAVIGVLPIGMNVQKDNREETVIGQDAQFFMDALRRGDRGLDDLTNYLIDITNYVYHFDLIGGQATTNINGYTLTRSFVNGVANTPQFPLTNGACIIGILSTPRYIPEYQLVAGVNTVVGYFSNYVFADFRALNGPAGEKFPQADTNILNFAFNYRLTPEITPVPTLENTSMMAFTFRTNLHDLRLQFRWPLLPSGVGNNRLSFRTQLAASLMVDTNNPRTLYYLDPGSVAFVSPQ